MGRDKQAYGFKYDDLDRLTESKYFDITDSYNSSNHQWSSSYSTDNKFQENVQYDVRGNITFLQRNGLNGGSWTSNGYTAATYGMIDNLGYIYGDSNRLKKVTEASLATKGFKYANSGNPRDFEYDKNGNLTADRNKSITNIEYNYLNLPQVITFTGNRKIQFVYDASGVKLRKITIHNDTVITYDYVNGVEYKNNILQRIAHTEGSVERNEFGAYEHQYVLRDHLGNTRVTFRDGINKGDAYFDWNTYQYIDPNAGNTTGLNDGTITSADIMQINHYYPFGLNMEGNWNGAAGNNKIQYNGKEWNDDFGLGMNDYGRRFYDPAIGRFPVVDRFTEKYSNMNPYQYGANNPIKFIDVNGDSIRPAEGQREQFVSEFKQVTDKLIEIGEGEPFQQLSDSKTVYTLKETEGMSGEEGSRFDPKTNTIYWNPRMGLLNNETLITMSPATVLAHELDHGARFDKDKVGIRKDQNTFDPDYNNKEEKRVVEGSEQRVARKLGEIKEGEVTRLNHGESPMSTDGPFSTEPPVAKTEKKKD